MRIRLTEATASCGTVCGRLKTWLKIINKQSWQFTHLLIKQDCLAFSLDRIIFLLSNLGMNLRDVPKMFWSAVF